MRYGKVGCFMTDLCDDKQHGTMKNRKKKTHKLPHSDVFRLILRMQISDIDTLLQNCSVMVDFET